MQRKSSVSSAVIPLHQSFVDKAILRSLTKSSLIDDLFTESDIFGSSINGAVKGNSKWFTSKSSEEALCRPLFSDHYETKSFKAPTRRVSTVTVPLVTPPRRKSSSASVSSILTKQSVQSYDIDSCPTIGEDIDSEESISRSDGISIYSSSCIKVPIAELPVFDFEQRNSAKNKSDDILTAFEEKYGSLKEGGDQTEADIWQLTQKQNWRLTYMRPLTICENITEASYEESDCGSILSWGQIPPSNIEETKLERGQSQSVIESSISTEKRIQKLNDILETMHNRTALSQQDLSVLLDVVKARIQISTADQSKRQALKSRFDQWKTETDAVILEIIDLYLATAAEEIRQ